MLFIQEGITNLRKRQNLWLGYFTKKKKKRNQNRNHRRIFPKHLSFGEAKNLRNNFLLPYTFIILNTLRMISNNYYEKFDGALVN